VVPVARAHNARATEVHVDRRVELISIVERLAGAEEYRRTTTPYAAEVDAAFARFADHPAITATKALRASHGISYDAPMWLATHLDDQLQPRAIDELATVEPRWAGVDLATYTAQLREFAATSKYDAFFAAHQAHYTAVADVLRTMVDAERPVVWFDALFGDRADATFFVIPGMLSGQLNFGPRVTLADGKVELFQIIGIHRADGMPETDAQAVALVVHEMAHSYINPLLARHRARLEPAGVKLFERVEQPMRAQAYTNWETMLNEAVVRAVTVLYMRDKHGDVAGAAAARDEIRRSFVWTNDLVEVVRKFQRSKHADLDTLTTAIAGFFDQLVIQYRDGLPRTAFLGPIDAAYTGTPTFVLPVGSEPLATYARKLHDQLFRTAPLLTASDRSFAESAGKHLVAFGSAATNPVVALALERAQWKITADAITLGTKTFRGPGLVLVACRFRHDDPTHGLVIYAAARDEDLVGFNHAVHHGTTDWLVARRTGKTFEVLGTGDFPRAVDGAWLLP
jgi:hypothetical protein